jgi:hypothetical protein
MWSLPLDSLLVLRIRNIAEKGLTSQWSEAGLECILKMMMDHLLTRNSLPVSYYIEPKHFMGHVEVQTANKIECTDVYNVYIYITFDRRLLARPLWRNDSQAQISNREIPQAPRSWARRRSRWWKEERKEEVERDDDHVPQKKGSIQKRNRVM